MIRRGQNPFTRVLASFCVTDLTGAPIENVSVYRKEISFHQQKNKEIHRYAVDKCRIVLFKYNPLPLLTSILRAFTHCNKIVNNLES